MKIILEGKTMSQMTPAEQEAVWTLSRYNEVYERDINGSLWRVLDLTNDENRHDSEIIVGRGGDNTRNIVRDEVEHN